MTHNPIASFPTNRLQALWHDVGRLTAHLRFPSLQSWEAQRLGGFLFPGASELVTKVGRALLYHPDLFHDGAATAAIGKGLLHRQARADALLALRDRFQDLADRLGDSHQQEQGLLAEHALSILNDLKVRAAIATTEFRERHPVRRPGWPNLHMAPCGCGEVCTQKWDFWPKKAAWAGIWIASICRMSLREIFARVLRQPTDHITDESSPATLKRWDSFNHVQLVISIEENFGIKLSTNEIDSLTSFGRARELLGLRGIAA